MHGQDVGEVATVGDDDLAPPAAGRVQEENEGEVEGQVDAVAQGQVLEQERGGAVARLRVPDPERAHVTQNAQQGYGQDTGASHDDSDVVVFAAVRVPRCEGVQRGRRVVDVRHYGEVDGGYF